MYFSFIGDLELLFLESKFLFILSEKKTKGVTIQDKQLLLMRFININL